MRSVDRIAGLVLEHLYTTPFANRSRVYTGESVTLYECENQYIAANNCVMATRFLVSQVHNHRWLQPNESLHVAQLTFHDGSIHQAAALLSPDGGGVLDFTSRQFRMPSMPFLVDPITWRNTVAEYAHRLYGIQLSTVHLDGRQVILTEQSHQRKAAL